MKRRLLFLAIPFCIGIIVILSIALRGTKLIVTIPEEYNLTGLKVRVDDTVLEPSGNGGRTFSANINPGEHDVQITSPVYKTYSEKINVAILSHKAISPQLEPITATDVASQTTTLEGYDISSEKLFGENWAVFIATPKNTPQADSLIVVARKNTAEFRWEVVEEGTSILTDILLDAPPELKAYVETL